MIPGPLVLGNLPLNLPAPTEDKDQTVSRRFEPSSRSALIGEQPNPWDLLQRADIEVPNRGVDVNSRPRSACYPQSTFYPLSDGASTSYRRITRSRFRVCPTCPSRSEAHFYPCARRAIADRAECTFELLRYCLGGNRPSQTDPLALSRGAMSARG